ncbi:MAG: bifunctional ornithine acetyltransferase/N-acetylglutamate synthase [Phycisphaerae bacterium]|nr:bifunctional ornithine acetyltransferase/N-acetylglutamate synthase [Phycisphaerae bacterium]
MSTPHRRADIMMPSRLPSGFAAATAKVGIRSGAGDDLLLLVADRPCAAAAVFTRNRFAAAPITRSRRHLATSGGVARALLLNAGCANAATGDRGDRDAASSVRSVADAVGCPVEQVLVNSTGVIGRPLPIRSMIAAIPRLAQATRVDHVDATARAIMTTDSAPKAVERTVPAANGGVIRIVGVAKGSGMVHPDLATMIGLVLTDAEVETTTLADLLRDSADRSFNRLSVDGDTSTNDSVFALASGAAGAAADPNAFADAVRSACLELARMIVADGEGASRVLEVEVTSAATSEEAREVARTVGGSLLVRTAVAGGDPNWGRIIAAIGRTSARFEPDRIRVEANLVPLFADGGPVADLDHAAARAFASERVQIRIDLDAGDARDTHLTCDLTAEYVRINADYTT